MPELARVYGLAPADVYALTSDELDAFLDHHAQLRGDDGP